MHAILDMDAIHIIQNTLASWNVSGKIVIALQEQAWKKLIYFTKFIWIFFK